MRPPVRPKWGSADNPIRMWRSTFVAVKECVLKYEEELERLPKEQQDAFIKKARSEIAKVWPDLFPGCHVYVVSGETESPTAVADFIRRGIRPPI